MWCRLFSPWVMSSELTAHHLSQLSTAFALAVAGVSQYSALALYPWHAILDTFATSLPYIHPSIRPDNKLHLFNLLLLKLCIAPQLSLWKIIMLLLTAGVHSSTRWSNPKQVNGLFSGFAVLMLFIYSHWLIGSSKRLALPFFLILWRGRAIASNVKLSTLTSRLYKW